jgi:Kef-type K+ transport system membrane component KefB
MLGLEYTASDLVSNLKAHYPSGLVDGALNAVPGAVAALLLGWGSVAAVVLAGVTWISSSGVIAKVLGDLGRVGNRETPVILSVLVLEDLAMAVYLPIVTALVAGAGLAAGSVTLAIALGVAGLVLFAAVRYGRVISRFVSSDAPEKLLLVVLVLTILVAGVAQQLQVSAAVGAFQVGIALSGEVAERAHPARPAARPVRRGLLRLLRPAHRPGEHPARARSGPGPGGRRRGHEDRHRVLGGPARRDLGQGTVAGGWCAGGARGSSRSSSPVSRSRRASSRRSARWQRHTS